MKSCIRRVQPVIFGWQQTPESVSICGGSPTKLIREPDTGALLETDRGWVLLDTGSPPRMGTDLEPVELPPISIVALSHLQYDHAGGLHRFADGRTPIYVQRSEYEFATTSATEAQAYYRADYTVPDLNWQFLDGDAEILPGLRALFTPGHTPGHQSFLVELSSGRQLIFAFDAADLEENIDREIGVGEAIGVTPAETVSAIRRLKKLGAPIIPGHDPGVWRALPREWR